MTMSSRRRSSDATPGAVVCVSHCCGTTCPSGPMASRATRTQACSTILARRASNPVRGHATAWSPSGSGTAATGHVTTAGVGGQRQGEAQASAQRDLHGLGCKDVGFIRGNGGQPSPGLGSSLRPEESAGCWVHHYLRHRVERRLGPSWNEWSLSRSRVVSSSFCRPHKP